MAEEKLNIQYLVNLLAEKHDLDKQSTEVFIREFFLLIEEALEKDKIIKIKGFGTFKITEVKSRESINVNTGERFEIEGHSKVSFTPDPSLRELINKPFSHFETIVLKDSVNFDNDSDEYEPPQDDDENNPDEIIDNKTPETIEIEPEQDDDVIIQQTSEETEVTENNEPVSGKIDERTETNTDSENIPETEEHLTEESEEKEPTIKRPLNEIIARELQETNRFFNKSIDGDVSADQIPNRPSKTFVITTIIIALLVCGTAVLYTYFPGFVGDLFTPKTTDAEIAQYNPPVIEETINEIPLVLTDTIQESENKEEIIEKVDERTPEPVNSVEPATQISSKQESPKAKPIPATTATEKKVQPVRKEKSSTGIDEIKSKPISYDSTPVKPDSTSHKIVGTKTEYTIKPGETLTRVALRFYGTKDLWPYLVMHNPSKIPDPQVVPAGLTIQIPELEKK